MLTSIQITKEVKEQLHSKKKKGESYEDVIRRLLNEEKQAIEAQSINKQKPKSTKKVLKPVRLIG